MDTFLPDVKRRHAESSRALRFKMSSSCSHLTPTHSGLTAAFLIQPGQAHYEPIPDCGPSVKCCLYSS